jgi:hypothetical protein
MHQRRDRKSSRVPWQRRRSAKQGSTQKASTHRHVHKTKAWKSWMVVVWGRRESERTLHKEMQSGGATFRFDSNLGSSLSQTYADSRGGIQPVSCADTWECSTPDSPQLSAIRFPSHPQLPTSPRLAPFPTSLKHKAPCPAPDKWRAPCPRTLSSGLTAR